SLSLSRINKQNLGFPVGYTELLLPKLLLHTLSILGFIRKLISFLFRSLGLGDFLEPDIAWPARLDCSSEPHSVSAILLRELLPVVQFSDLLDPPESCAVCLYDFDGGDEIRRLTNCRHIFHRSCLDRWMDHDHRNCPLYRTLFIPDDLQDVFTARLWAASGISDYYGEYSPITAGMQEAGPHSIWWFDLRGNNIIIFSLLSFPPTALPADRHTCTLFHPQRTCFPLTPFFFYSYFYYSPPKQNKNNTHLHTHYHIFT
ncbi:E3 ubiquitin-protein ligase RHA1B-like, partial [Camellia sinensis]|uniref:E3 ubiquitin-protein ligase RHA1B-like n=1 Tax=Camellia sinensis TaxID=4442 RepID=UPI001035BB40